METFTHTCITPGCENTYQDTDPDAYYCAHHQAEMKAVAKQIDAKVQARGPKRATRSLLQEYDASPKVRGFVRTTL